MNDSHIGLKKKKLLGNRSPINSCRVKWEYISNLNLMIPRPSVMFLCFLFGTSWKTMRFRLADFWAKISNFFNIYEVTKMDVRLYTTIALYQPWAFIKLCGRIEILELNFHLSALNGLFKKWIRIFQKLRSGNALKSMWSQLCNIKILSCPSLKIFRFEYWHTSVVKLRIFDKNPCEIPLSRKMCN